MRGSEFLNQGHLSPGPEGEAVAMGLVQVGSARFLFFVLRLLGRVGYVPVGRGEDDGPFGRSQPKWVLPLFFPFSFVFLFLFNSKLHLNSNFIWNSNSFANGGIPYMILG